jgi:two-component system response regulator HydG
VSSEPVKILLVEDDPAHREATKKLLAKQYEVVAVDRPVPALKAMAETQFDVVVTDLNLPEFDGIELLKRIKAADPAIEVVMLTGHGTVERAVEAMRLGAYDFVEKQDQLRVPLLKAVGKALEKRLLAAENQQLREQLQLRRGEEMLMGNASTIVAIRKLVLQIAPSDVSVLIQGESGTGKEVVADMIHQLSGRRARPMVKISCAAIPETLLESELFGYEKGAFTGATGTKPGKFELAHGGSIFLDEIAEMSPPLQAKLLRVLQDGRYQRLGGTKDIEVDVRVISATNVDIAKAIEEKKFRDDLFYRLNVVHLVVPPLRERMEDTPLLADHFLKRFAARMQKPARGFQHEALERLAAHRWPGNVRELENVIQRAVTTCAGEMIAPDDLAFSRVTAKTGAAADRPTIAVPLGAPMKEVESIVMAETLKQFSGDKEKAAKVLGVSSRTIYRRFPPPARKKSETKSKK